MIEGVASSCLRRQAFRDPQITLDKLKELGQALEQAEQQADKMEAMSGSTESSISVISKYNSKKKKDNSVEKQKPESVGVVVAAGHTQKEKAHVRLGR